MRAALWIGVAVLAAGCGGNDAPAAKAPPPNPAGPEARPPPGPPPRALTLRVDDAAAPEAAGTLAFSVRVSEQVRGEPVRVEYATENGTATDDDYVAASGVLEFMGTTTTRTVTVTLRDDTVDEPDETLRLRATVVNGAERFEQDEVRGTGTVTDDDEPPPRPQPPQGVWLSTDLHVHDDHSSDGSFTRQGPGQGGPGNMAVADQLRFSESQGLDFLALTDHRTFDQHYDPQWRSERLLLLTGEEANSSPHATVFGAVDMINQGATAGGATELRRLQQGIWDAQLQGAVWAHAHPADGQVNPDGSLNEFSDSTGAHLAEAWKRSNLPAGHLAYCEDRWNAGYRFGVSGGSDNHFKEVWPIAGPGTPLVRVFARNRSTPAILDGLRAGRTTLSLNDHAPFVTLDGDFDGDGVFEALGGDEARAAPGATARLRVTLKGGAGTTVVVYRMPGVSAGPFATFTPSLLEERFTLDITADRPQDWYRVEVRGPGEISSADYEVLLDGDPLGAIEPDPANQLRALSSPLFIATGAAAQPASVLPADAGAADGAQVLFGQAHDNAFAGFADLAEAAGVVHAVAEVRGDGASRVLYRRLAEGVLSQPVDLAPTSKLARQPRIAAAGAHVWVVWQDGRAGEVPHRPQIVARHSADAGQTWGAEQVVAGGEGRAEHPDVALLAPDRPVVAWHDNAGGAFDVYARVLGGAAAAVNLSAAGKTVTAGHPADARSAVHPASLHPAVAVRGDGTIVVAWQDNRFDADPGWTGRMIHSDEVDDSLQQGEFVENGTETDDWEILAATLAPGAAAWSVPANASAASDRADRHVSLVFAGDGVLHAAWDSKTNDAPAGRNLAIHVARSPDRGSTWSGPQAVALDAATSAQRPTLATRAGAPVLLWTDGRSADWRWRIRRADFDGAAWRDAGHVTGAGNAGWPSYAGGWIAFTSDRAATREQRKPQQVFLRAE